MPQLFLAIARLHRQGITSGFLSTLGDRFLSLLYLAIAHCPYSVVLTASEELESGQIEVHRGEETGGDHQSGAAAHEPVNGPGQEHDHDTPGPVVGFVAATTDTRRMYRWILLRYGWRFALLLLGKLVRPADLKKIMETLFYSSDEKTHAALAQGENRSEGLPQFVPAASSLHHFPPAAELLAISVEDRIRGAGVGRALVREMEGWLLSREVDEYKVVTLAADARANAFYRACGCQALRDFLHHGNVMREYVGRGKN